MAHGEDHGGSTDPLVAAMVERDLLLLRLIERLVRLLDQKGVLGASEYAQAVNDLAVRWREEPNPPPDHVFQMIDHLLNRLEPSGG